MDEQLTGPTPIDGVIVQPLKVIRDERGAVLHMLRADASFFRKFGEVYFSEVHPGVVKAWRRHRRMAQHLAVPVGRAKFVIVDDRDTSPTRGRVAEVILGRPDAYQLLVLPPLLWYGFQALGVAAALVVNCTDLPHDPTEVERAETCPALPTYVW